MSKKMTYKQFLNIAENDMGFSIEEDNYGQIIIYTGLQENENGSLEEFEEEDRVYTLWDKLHQSTF